MEFIWVLIIRKNHVLHRGRWWRLLERRRRLLNSRLWGLFTKRSIKIRCLLLRLWWWRKMVPLGGRWHKLAMVKIRPRTGGRWSNTMAKVVHLLVTTIKWGLLIVAIELCFKRPGFSRWRQLITMSHITSMIKILSRRRLWSLGINPARLIIVCRWLLVWIRVCSSRRTRPKLRGCLLIRCWMSWMTMAVRLVGELLFIRLLC